LISAAPKQGIGRPNGAAVGAELVNLPAATDDEGISEPAQTYLVWAFERLGTHRDVFDLPLEAPTLAAFEKTLG